MLRVIFFLFLFSSSLISLAQHRCGTVEYAQLLTHRRPSRETAEQFELWMKDKIAQKKSQPGFTIASVNNYEIPVVVHVIHNGEEVGTGANISDAQILSQIKVLNDDFQRLNADSVQTPGEFFSVEGKFNVNFVLAKQDPDGAATNGILRVQGSQSSWDMQNDYTLKAQSYWPAEKYFNIWVTNLSGGLLGYTQLPSSSTLQGLDGNSIDRLTDGIVIHYKAFGSKDGGAFDLLSKYNLGRTVTHEAGHFFGLRHVWGDVFSCTGTDYVSDTPPQNTDFNGQCPSGTDMNCGGSAMYSNYMNYTDDACMNIFSKGQVARMDVIINNSPRRASLLTSLGSQPPILLSNDIQLKSLVTPATTACSGNVSPALLIRNFGSNNISSSQIQFLVNGSSTETKSFPLSLTPGQETTVFFSPVSLVAGTTYKFSFQVIQTNSVTDGRAYNDTLNHTFKVPLTATLPLVESFDQLPTNWTVLNPDGLETWKSVLVGSEKAVFMNFYNYENRKAIDLLVSPVLDLTSATIASVSFDYAYSAYLGQSDRLRVLVSPLCDFSSSPVEIFNKAGADLATTRNQYSSGFIPTSTQWSNKILSLNQFLGKKIQIAFEATNEWGNNLYLDNVVVVDSAFSGFVINSLVSPSPVSCLTSASPVLNIRNLGNTVIESFTADIYLNRVLTSTQYVSNQPINVGASKNISFPELSLTDINTFSVVIKSPNGSTGVSSKDSLTSRRYVNAAKEKIPFRQNFDIDYSGWTSVTPDYGLVWKPYTTTIRNNSMAFEAFASDSANIGKQAWLVSPILDFSSLKKASLFFETSYATNPPGEELLQVFYSTDCGQTFDKQAFILSGSNLALNNYSSAFWAPSEETDWSAPKRYINLDSVVGKENVRLAFVATNGNGNNLFIDNIELFVDDNQDPVTIDSEYTVYGGLGTTDIQVTFKLKELQTVHLQVYDLMGHVITDLQLPDTLNQTYVVESPGYARGMYIVRVQTQRSTSSTKVFFGF